MDIVYIGMGSNQGEPLQNLKLALKAMEAHPQIKIARVAGLYLTEPVGYTEQAWFHNTVAEIETDLSPKSLLAVLQKIELDLGRVRDIRWGPRTLDLDILAYADGRSLEEPDLQVPHPRLTERAFVTTPLAKLAPELIIQGQSVLEWDKFNAKKQKVFPKNEILW